MARYLNSDAIPLYNPIEEYLNSTGHWDGKDRIRALADLVPCNNPYWRELYRWFLSMTAHWQNIDRQHGNNTSPYWSEPKAIVKVPSAASCCHRTALRIYRQYRTSKSYGAERSLGRFFLINIDEFDQISVNQQGFQHLLQKPVANLRKPYGTAIQEIRRYASFIATSNQKDLLTDPSGSRRFICIEVTGPIHTNVTINYRQLYAQAMDAIAKGERYWLDDSDEAILKQTNREFEQPTLLEQLFLCHFHPAENEEEGDWMTPMEILSFLQTKTKDRLSINKVALFGRALHKLGISSRRKTRGTEYHVVKKE